MRFVPVKTADQQAALMLVGVRERLIRNRTQLANAIRGFAIGIWHRRGRWHVPDRAVAGAYSGRPVST